MLLGGRDGCVRDMASMHGSYRKVDETEPALTLIGEVLNEFRPAECCWYLDRPVSNSGRLRARLEQLAAERRLAVAGRTGHRRRLRSGRLSAHRRHRRLGDPRPLRSAGSISLGKSGSRRLPSVAAVILHADDQPGSDGRSRGRRHDAGGLWALTKQVGTGLRPQSTEAGAGIYPLAAEKSMR